MIETGETNPKIVIEITLQGEKVDFGTIYRVSRIYVREISAEI